MSYFNIFLKKTFSESSDESSLLETIDDEPKEIFKTIDSNAEPETKDPLQIYDKSEYDYLQDVQKEVYLANNRKEDFFKIIESPSSRSSVPRSMTIDAASVNENFNIVLYHTHGTEAYLPYEESNYHTKDENYNVMGIGNRIASNIANYGLNITHLKNYNDYPDYNSSYANSNYAVSQVLSNSKKNLIIDLHRDGADEGSNYEEFLSKVKTVEINGMAAATCTLVIGNKNENFEKVKKTAQAIYDTSNEMYPGLFRDIVIREGAYFNQYLTDYAMLIELGTTLNDVEEAQYSADLLSEILCKTIEKLNK